ncbi:hypothetical protein A3B55_02600 [Candidatus Daviesbacteria bacterium RIFCSPLOWO2_01_FULL_43_15]|nr:MAG: hypothetical protein A3B55_02600 [Candidatus Daviesbacteria bacterium RIFCSPLOWO2_01_FULL_43_15]
MPLQKISFNYTPLLVRDPKTSKFVRIYRPMVPVKLFYRNRSTGVINCVLDSGADRSLFPAAYALQLGFDVKKQGEESEVVGIGGHKVSVYILKVQLGIVSEKPEIFRTEIAFSYDHNHPVLGRKGFFDLFERVEFGEKKKIVELVL